MSGTLYEWQVRYRDGDRERAETYVRDDYARERVQWLRQLEERGAPYGDVRLYRRVVHEWVPLRDRSGT